MCLLVPKNLINKASHSSPTRRCDVAADGDLYSRKTEGPVSRQ